MGVVQTGDIADNPGVEGLGFSGSIPDKFVHSLPLLSKLAKVDVTKPEAMHSVVDRLDTNRLLAQGASEREFLAIPEEGPIFVSTAHQEVVGIVGLGRLGGHRP